MPLPVSVAFFNGCCYGIPTSLPIGVVFPVVDDLPRYPTQLFSMAAGLLIFFILEWVSPRIRFRGQVVALLFILYGVTRSVIELFRENSTFWGRHTPLWPLWALPWRVVSGTITWRAGTSILPRPT